MPFRTLLRRQCGILLVGGTLLLLAYSRLLPTLYRERWFRVQSYRSASRKNVRPASLATTSASRIYPANFDIQQSFGASISPTDAYPSFNSSSRGKTAQLHYLIPASHPKIQLCYNLVSSAVNRYPPPVLLGWYGSGEYNAAASHLAKLHALRRYFLTLQSDEDDDLALIVDGYDVIQQLPPSVIIQRYFEIRDKADAHLAARLGMSVQEAHARNLRQTIFSGPDQVCFPQDSTALRCRAAPPSPLVFPQLLEDGKDVIDVSFDAPRWLNSGTFIGPVRDIRRLIEVAMEEIAWTWSADYQHRESDQYYISNVWGRQEYWREKQTDRHGPADDQLSGRFVLHDRLLDLDTELHLAIEYESALFQTRAQSEQLFGYLRFNESGPTAMVDSRSLNLGRSFRPYAIHMPGNVRSALSALYDAIPHAHPGSHAADWIYSVRLGVNFISQHIYGLWHCTGYKEFIDAEYPKLWWYPFARSLLRAAIKSSQAGDLISLDPIDGRRWTAKTFYPDSEAIQDEFGGAWSDGGTASTWVPWSTLCGPHEHVLFRGERRSVRE